MMKKLLVTLMVFAMCIGSGFTTALAADKVSVSFDTIEKIMLSSSTDLQRTKADLDKAQGDYSDLEHLVKAYKEQNAVAPSSTLTSYYNQAKTQRDAAEIYYLTLKLAYDKSVMLQVLKTQQLYLTYDMDKNQEQILEKQLENKKLEITAYNAKLKAGFITQNDYDMIDLNLQTLNDSISTQKQKTASDLNIFRTALGLAEDAQLEILPVSYNETVFALIPSMNFDADNAAMIQNNVDVKAKETALNIKQDATIKVNREINLAKVELEQAKENAALSFRQQYDSLMNVYRNYQTFVASLKLNEKTVENARLKYQYGYITKLQLNDLEIAYSNARLSATAQKNALYCTYLRYVQMKNGD